MANITSTPGKDHTTGSSWGKCKPPVMFHCAITLLIIHFKLIQWHFKSVNKCFIRLQDLAFDYNFLILLLRICLLDTGHVMHTDGNQGGAFSTAILEYSVDKVAALGCQIRY